MAASSSPILKPEGSARARLSLGRRSAPRPWRRRAFRYWFALPSILVVGIFFGLPLVANTIFAFLQWTGFTNVISWDGLANFRELIALGVLWHAILVTVIYAVVCMAVQNIVGLALAKALQQSGRVNTVFRSVFFVPVLFSPLAAGYIWAGALQTPGPVDSFLSAILPGTVGFAWLGHPTAALLSVAAIDGWRWSGLVTIVYIAGLNRIPHPLLEAARLDGAGVWKRFWRIEFPLLVPAITFNVVIGLVGAFSAIDVVFATTSGGPGDATFVLNVALYHQFSSSLFGTASALGLVINALVVFTAVPLIMWLRRHEVQM